MTIKMDSFYTHNHVPPFGKCKYYSLFFTSIKMLETRTPEQQLTSCSGHRCFMCQYPGRNPRIAKNSSELVGFAQWVPGTHWGSLASIKAHGDVCKSRSFKMQMFHLAVEVSEFAPFVAQGPGPGAVNQ